MNAATSSSIPFDAAVFQRTSAGQREVVFDDKQLESRARSLLLMVNGLTPLYLLGVHSAAAASSKHAQELLDLALIEAVTTDAAPSLQSN